MLNADRRAILSRWLTQLSRMGLVIVLLLTPFWRHRVLLRRPPYAIYYALRDVIAYTSDYFLLCTLGAWLLSRALHGGDEKLRTGPPALFAPAVGLLSLGLVSAIWAVDPPLTLYHALRLGLLLVFYVFLSNARFIPLPLIAWAVAASVAFQAIVGLLQFAQGRSLGLYRLGELVLDPAWPGISVVMAGEERWLRAHGLTQHPNLLGGLLMAGLLLLVGYSLARPRAERLALAGVFCLGLAALLASFSRAAWLGALAGGGALLLLLSLTPANREMHWRALLPVVMVTLAILMVFAATYWHLLMPRLGLTTQGTEIRSLEERSVLASGALALIRLRPVLGVGWGNFALALYRLAPESVAAYPFYQPVHNVFLLLTAELGPGGSVLWLAVTAAPWLTLWLQRRELHMTAWWAGLSGALLSLSVVDMFDAYFWTSQQGLLVRWLLLGLWAREWVRQVTDNSGKECGDGRYSAR